MLSVAYLVATSCCTVLYIPNSYNSPFTQGQRRCPGQLPGCNSRLYVQNGLQAGSILHLHRSIPAIHALIRATGITIRLHS
ncbi:MAG TPA: hypothetical protein PKL74_10030, partial [Tenuifilaceae bacterium]|nr:hypothetical protein [Tenuifilaceae bacterium]